MRVALVHSFYSPVHPSGENVAVTEQARLLERAGHQVTVIGRYSAVTPSPARKVQLAFSVASGIGPDPLKELDEFRPDLVHVHNLFPNFGTRWLGSWDGPLIATLHNFRTACIRGTFFRDGSPCFDCPTHSRWEGFRNACYRDSRLASLPLTLRTRGPRQDPLIVRAERIIALSERARSLLVRFGLPVEKCILLPNFATPATSAVSASDNWVFVGRGSDEKGLRQLLDHWPNHVPLTVFGADSGPVRPRPNVTLCGQVPPDEIRKHLPGFCALAFPSRWPEGAIPLVIVEALASGVPVVALAGNGGADVIEGSGAGVVVRRDADWPDAIQYVTTHRERMSKAALALYEREFTPEAWLDQYERLGSELIRQHQQRSGG